MRSLFSGRTEVTVEFQAAMGGTKKQITALTYDSCLGDKKLFFRPVSFVQLWNIFFEGINELIPSSVLMITLPLTLNRIVRILSDIRGLFDVE